MNAYNLKQDTTTNDILITLIIVLYSFIMLGAFCSTVVFCPYRIPTVALCAILLLLLLFSVWWIRRLKDALSIVSHISIDKKKEQLRIIVRDEEKNIKLANIALVQYSYAEKRNKSFRNNQAIIIYSETAKVLFKCSSKHQEIEFTTFAKGLKKALDFEERLVYRVRPRKIISDGMLSVRYIYFNPLSRNNSVLKEQRKKSGYRYVFWYILLFFLLFFLTQIAYYFLLAR